MGDGDGWIVCALGHRHWGRHGAAGLLLRDPDGSALLQHRAPWTHEGGTWGVPGGARDSHEDPVQTALREAREEAALTGDHVDPVGWWTTDHGGWAYTTVVAHAPRGLPARAANAESTEIRWWTAGEVAALPLHGGFAASWALLADAVPDVRIVVDAANVVGARPDGWWRDRRGAAGRLLDRLGALVRRGIAAADLPVDAGTLGGVYPQMHVVLEGQARGVRPTRPGWWTRRLRVHDAERDGDATVVDVAAAPGAPTIVVTADNGLRQRLDPSTVQASPSWLLRLIERDEPAGAR